MIENKEKYIKAASEACRAVCSTESIDAEIDELLQEIEVVTEMTKKFITENTGGVQDRYGYTNRYNTLVER